MGQILAFFFAVLFVPEPHFPEAFYASVHWILFAHADNKGQNGFEYLRWKVEDLESMFDHYRSGASICLTCFGRFNCLSVTLTTEI